MYILSHASPLLSFPAPSRSRFQPVHVPEPTVDETYEILRGLRERYEAHHKLRYTDEALMAAAKYSSQVCGGGGAVGRWCWWVGQAGLVAANATREAAMPRSARSAAVHLLRFP